MSEPPLVKIRFWVGKDYGLKWFGLAVIWYSDSIGERFLMEYASAWIMICVQPDLCC